MSLIPESVKYIMNRCKEKAKSTESHVHVTINDQDIVIDNVYVGLLFPQLHFRLRTKRKMGVLLL